MKLQVLGIPSFVVGEVIVNIEGGYYLVLDHIGDYNLLDLSSMELVSEHPMSKMEVERFINDDCRMNFERIISRYKFEYSTDKNNVKFEGIKEKIIYFKGRELFVVAEKEDRFYLIDLRENKIITVSRDTEVIENKLLEIIKYNVFSYYCKTHEHVSFREL